MTTFPLCTKLAGWARSEPIPVITIALSGCHFNGNLTFDWQFISSTMQLLIMRVFVCLCVCVAVIGMLQKQKNIAGALAFWMANASELLNFIKQDRDLNRITLDAQDILAHLVQMAFKSVCVSVLV